MMSIRCVECGCNCRQTNTRWWGASIARSGGALVLMGSVLAAWRHGGQQWKAWSLRCVPVLLALTGCTGQLNVLSYYPPTRAA